MQRQNKLILKRFDRDRVRFLRVLQNHRKVGTIRDHAIPEARNSNIEGIFPQSHKLTNI